LQDALIISDDKDKRKTEVKVLYNDEIRNFWKLKK
jgi:hypothetical protein